MQAKVIATGEIVEVIKTAYDHKLNEAIYTDSNNIHNVYYQYELEFLPSIDWEQRRFELAKAMLPKAFEIADEYYKSIDEDMPDGGSFLKFVAENAIWYADAVIEKLKEEKYGTKEV